jgi:hypothetical protein
MCHPIGCIYRRDVATCRDDESQQRDGLHSTAHRTRTLMSRGKLNLSSPCVFMQRVVFCKCWAAWLGWLLLMADDWTELGCRFSVIRHGAGVVHSTVVMVRATRTSSGWPTI